MNAAPTPLDGLVARLAGDQPRVVVVGLGYVGLPLAVALAESGALVTGVDVDRARIEAVAAGRSHLGDLPDERLAATVGGRTRGRLEATDGFDAVTGADAVVTCVPTPLRKTRDPDISHVVAASREVASRARPGQLVVLESTTYPGTTVDLLAPLLAERDLLPGRDIALAFSPERVDPGNRQWTLANTPKVVGGVTPACTAAARALYARTCSTIVEVSSPTAAEMVKLLENTFRSVNIGLVNEFALICRRLGVDVWEVVDGAATKPFGFMPFRPGPGLGGHCIPVDPQYLAWRLRALNFPARFIELADAVNSRMPEHVVEVVTEAFNDRGLPVRGRRILALGVTYKPDVADVRESPSVAVIELLVARGADVRFHDFLVDEVQVGSAPQRRVELEDAEIAAADCVLVLTHHTAYDFETIVRAAKLVVDTRNATGPVLARHPELRARVQRT